MRRATFADLPRLLDLTGRLVTASGIPQAMDPAYTVMTLRTLMSRPDAPIWITDGGFLAASIERTVISPQPVAVEHGWYADDGKGQWLRRAFENWATGQGARKRLSTGANGPDLSRVGYRMVEQVWVKD